MYMVPRVLLEFLISRRIWVSKRIMMNSDSQAHQTVQLNRGETLPESAPGCVWRLVSGALRLHNAHRDNSEALVSLALPGDLIGVERLAGSPLPMLGLAILPARLTEVKVDDGELPEVVKSAYMCALRRSADMVALRGGSVPNRVRHLLLLIAENQRADTGTAGITLPSLRDIADIINATRETVSRVLGGLKKLDLLHDRKAQSGLLKVPDLRQFSFLPGMTCSTQLATERLGRLYLS
jgi:CRP-like cAMP-binding protein